MTEPGAFSKSEMMIVAAARELAGQRVCFVGVGLPNIAVNLAKRTVAPELELVYEAGVFGARPARLPLSIGDPTIVTGATAVVEHARAVRLLPPARADRRRVPGRRPDRPVRQHQHDRHRPVRPPDDAAARLGRRLRDRDQRPPGLRDHAPERSAASSRRSTSGRRPATSAAPRQAERIRREGGWLGRGPTVVVTDLGIYHFDDAGEMRLDSLHPGATVEGVRDDDRLGRGDRARTLPRRRPRPTTSCG